MNKKKYLIELIHLYKSYSKKGSADIEVLKDINITIEEGKKIAIMGRSGAGKATLLHILGTLENPSSGHFLYKGEEMTFLNEKNLAQFRNQKMGFVFQFHYLLDEFNSLENVAIPLLIGGVSKEEALVHAEFWLDQVGLIHRLKHKPSELSGGEKQRVALARALINKPEILFTDEVTGNLDSKTASKIQELIYQMQKKYKTTLISVTHDAQIASDYDQILRIEDGILVE